MRYRVVEKLEERGQRVVYRAHDPKLTRDVALEIVSGHEDEGEHLHREAQALARLQHPNVISVYDVGRDGRGVYIATELVEGKRLPAWLTDEPRSWRDILSAFEQAGQGLAAAHRAGLVHGDFKPDNVIVGDDGRVRVSEFGLMGTADAQTDQLAFCAALSEALASRSVPRRVRAAIQPHPSMTALLVEIARARSKSTRKHVGLWSAGVAIGAAFIAVSISAREKPALTCAPGRPLLEDAWSADQRARVAAAFARVGEPWAQKVHGTAEAMLDQYAARWADMHEDSCEATRVSHRQSALVFDARAECLRRHRDDLRETVDVLATADKATLERAIEIIQGLPAIDACADIAALTAPVPPPKSPQARTSVALLRKRLARGRALADAAKFADAARIASSVVEQARSIPYRPLEAEALLDESNALERQGKYHEAATAAKNASVAAQAGRHDQVAAQSLLALLWLTGVRERHYARAHELATEASAAIERLEKRTALEAELARTLGSIYAHEGRLDDALAQENRYLATIEAADGAEGPAVGGALVDIGEIYREQGRHTDALASYQRALDIFESAWGPEHPTAAVPLNNIGLVLRRLGRNDEALAYHRRALAIFERRLGSQHPHVAEARTNIGVILLAEGQTERAYGEFKRALAIDTKLSGPESVEAAIDWINMADARRVGNRLPEAIRDGQKALAIAKASVGDEDPITAEAHLTLGKTLAAKRSYKSAIEHFRRALAIWQRPDAELDAGAGEALLELASARLALGDHSAAIAAAERAVGLLERSSRDPAALPAARALLEQARTSR